jgi:putative sigma-54 modulation protein
MKVEIQSIHFVHDVKLASFIEEKLNKLDTFFDKILSAEVYLRLNKDAESKKNKVVEIKLYIPGGSLFVKEHDISFEAAVDIATEALKVQIKKHKEKLVEKHHSTIPAE